MVETPLEDAVLAELHALRKDSGGVTVSTLARASTICQLLGSGDPAVAYTRLQHALLDATLDRTTRAAAASLGFASTGDTHLDRLVEAGVDLGLDQRHVRRLSDQGLQSLARLIATNWAVESAPELTVIVVASVSAFELHLATTRPLVVEMSDPTVDILSDDDRAQTELDWALREGEEHEGGALRQPIVIERTKSETSVVIVWRGELWPKFTTSWHGPYSNVMMESLGNKLMLRLVGSPQSEDL
jgi:hypothetical protein